MKKTIIYALVIWLNLLLLCSCGGKNRHEPMPSSKALRTVLVYMIATNTLNGYEEDDIDEMKAAISGLGDTKCRLLVYRVSYNERTPKLFEIVKSGNSAVEKVLKVYDATSRQSVTTKRMSEVLADVKALAPSEEYGLVLWSHSNGWAITKSVNRLSNKRSSINLNNFGDDYGASMPIDSLAKAIPDGMFKFIYADACYLGAVEVAYELRNDTRYFVGSPTEVLSYGMPYDKNVPCFFAKTPDLAGACKNMFDFYDSKNGIYQSATICLVDCSKLDAVAAACKDIGISSTNIDTSNLQCYNSSNNRFYFDFLQTYRQIANDNQYTRLEKTYEEAVLYKAATPSFLSELIINPAHYSGLSTYIPGSSSASEKAYKALAWYKDVVVR